MIASFAAKYYGRRIGIVSGLMVVTSFYVLIQARLAESDMLLTALVCAAMLIFASGPVSEAEDPSTPRKTFRQQLFAARPIVFYLLAGLTFLLKGFVGPAFIFAGVITYAAIQRDRRAAYFLLNPRYLPLPRPPSPSGLGGIPPNIPHLNTWHSSNSASSPRARQRSLFFYPIPSRLAAPWTPFMLFSTWVPSKPGQHRRPLNRFFICWFIPVIILSLSAFKHQHYAFPLLPPAQLLARRFAIHRLPAPQTEIPPGLRGDSAVDLYLHHHHQHIKLARPILPVIVVIMGLLFSVASQRLR
jgi:4-amino-4-deoxy-L-arabinose transferase-like glycosyltransferase